MTAVQFTVYGTPAPAGSKKGFVNKRTGRVIITDDSKRSRPWKALVTDAALQATNGAAPLTGPLALTVTFYVARPKNHHVGAATERPVRPSAPAYPITRPDASKLVRAAEDAMTGVVWGDDAQVVDQHAYKRYGEPPRCEIRVEQIG